jgi:hypothetical protein
MSDRFLREFFISIRDIFIAHAAADVTSMMPKRSIRAKGRRQPPRRTDEMDHSLKLLRRSSRRKGSSTNGRHRAARTDDSISRRSSIASSIRSLSSHRSTKRVLRKAIGLRPLSSKRRLSNSVQHDDLKPLDVIHRKSTRTWESEPSALSICSNQSNSTVKRCNGNGKAKISRQTSQRLERGEHMDYLYGRIMTLWKHFLCDPILHFRENACGHSEYMPDNAQVERWKQFREMAKGNQGETLVSTLDSLPQVVEQAKKDEQDTNLETTTEQQD